MCEHIIVVLELPPNYPEAIRVIKCNLTRFWGQYVCTVKTTLSSRFKLTFLKLIIVRNNIRQ